MRIDEYPDGATPLDSDEAAGLLLTHITTRGELDRWEQDNILDAIAWLDRTKPTDVLDDVFARELHRRMFGDVWSWAGQYRRSDKNIGVPWSQVPEEVRKLMADARCWVDVGEDGPDEIGVRFHHRLVAIHAFPNGNGRHARLMTDAVLENVLGTERFSWGGRDLSRPGGVRAAYIAALQAADRMDYEALERFARS